MQVIHKGTTGDFIAYLSRRNTMLDTLRPFISRLIAPFITAALGFLAVRFGLNFGEDAGGHITEYSVVLFIGLAQFINGAVHKAIDKKVNPGDAASATLASAEKVEAGMLKV